MVSSEAMSPFRPSPLHRILDGLAHQLRPVVADRQPAQDLGQDRLQVPARGGVRVESSDAGARSSMVGDSNRNSRSTPSGKEARIESFPPIAATTLASVLTR